MKVFVIILTLALSWKSRISHAKPANRDPYMYLQRYGYVASMTETLVGGATRPSAALRKFQKYAGIPITGMMDPATIAKLTGPRCGSRDTEPTRGVPVVSMQVRAVTHGVPGSFRDIRRKKRYVQQGSTWKKKSLTYSVHGTRKPWRKISSSEVERTIDKAFAMWQHTTDLTFTKLRPGVNADIIIKFSRGNHGDFYPFDGSGGTLAHGFYPGNNKGLAGDIHFDNDETWSLKGEKGTTDFLWTSLHEIGHALGLGHSEKSNSIMWPWFQGYERGLKLKKDDIEGIQSIYGMPRRPLSELPKPRNSDFCRYSSRNFDVVMYQRQSHNTYFFQGNHMWEMDSRKMASNRVPISSRWKDLPGSLDAAYTRMDNKMVFFKADRYWIYGKQFQLVESGKLKKYIRNVRKMKLDRLDAAMIWGGNGKTYFFRGSKYWRYNESKRKIDPGYPIYISKQWRGVPTPMYGAMTWEKSKTFFFYKNKMYRYDNVHRRVKFRKKKYKHRVTYFIKNCR